MAEFTVCIPDHDPHLQCFRDIAEGVMWALGELGHTVHDQPRPVIGSRPIYFGLPLGRIETDAILYNGEQVSPQSIWTTRRLEQVYRNYTVWDYSIINADRYQQYGLSKPPVVRPGYCPLLEWHDAEVEKTHDIVFFGSSNERRERVLLQAQQMGLSLLRVPFGMYGAERDALLQRARLCLNIHFYDSAIFEAVRCSYLAMGRLPVLSEISAGHEGARYGMTGVAYEQLAPYATALIADPNQLRDLGASQAAATKQVSLLDDVGAALEALNHKPVVYALPTVEGKAFPRLTLSMIVKDESAVIERCLASVKPYLKQWCIVDTGSTDGTQDIIRKFMADVPGSLHERPWKEYDGSRTEALDLARKECGEQGWLLLIDADELLYVEGDLVLPDGYDCYNAWITRCLGCTRWGRSTFLRAKKPWFYEMPRHEGLYCREHGPSRDEPIPNAVVISTKDGARAKEDEYERYLEDAHVLEAWLLKHPGHARCQYYIAQSYRDAATGKVPFDRAAMQKAVLHYLKRAAMGGFAQEVHSALFWAANSMDKLQYPWEQVQQRLLEAYNQRPGRAEAIFTIGRHYRELKQYPLAEVFLRKAAAIPMTTDRFAEVDRTIYEWKAKEELAVALTWLSQYTEARDLNREVLARPDLAPSERVRIQANLDTCLKFAPDRA